MPVEYASDGLYNSLVTVPTHGLFRLSLRLGNVSTLLTGNANCPNGRQALVDGRCGCEAGEFEEPSTQSCKPCPLRTTSRA